MGIKVIFSPHRFQLGSAYVVRVPEMVVKRNLVVVTDEMFVDDNCTGLISNLQ